MAKRRRFKPTSDRVYRLKKMIPPTWRVLNPTEKLGGSLPTSTAEGFQPQNIKNEVMIIIMKGNIMIMIMMKFRFYVIYVLF